LAARSTGNKFGTLAFLEASVPKRKVIPFVRTVDLRRVPATVKTGKQMVGGLDLFREALPLLIGCADAGGLVHRYSLTESHLRHIRTDHFAGDASMGRMCGDVPRILRDTV
jgi:hypothetical protein